MKDHLRACGEQLSRIRIEAPEAGSSPRMRRTVSGAIIRPLDIGIISAHAENRPAPSARRRRTRDHLRACGEQSRVFHLLNAIPGSSPRMRRTARRNTLTTAR